MIAPVDGNLVGDVIVCQTADFAIVDNLPFDVGQKGAWKRLESLINGLPFVTATFQYLWEVHARKINYARK